MKKYDKIIKPAICFDVDGVLRKGTNALPHAKESIKKLRLNNVPISIITNSGGEPEYKRTEKYNIQLGLEKEFELKPYEIIMCHTPMRRLIETYTNELILIAGIDDIISVMNHYNYRNFITFEEYFRIFPNQFPYIWHNCDKECKKTRELVEHRISKELKDFPRIDSVLILSDVIKWEFHIQLLSDFIISRDGIPGSIRRKNEPQIVDLNVACVDLLYTDKFNLPRIGAGGFFYSFLNLFKKKYGLEVKYQIYGKPSSKIFNYARENIRELYSHYQISNFYMIGDNPSVDIKGANENDFISILVKTGVFDGDKNDPENAAKYVQDHVGSAVDKILSIENLH